MSDIVCPHRTPIDSQWGRCALLPVVHPDCPPARVHTSACTQCQTSPAALAEVFANLANGYRGLGYYAGDEPAAAAQTAAAANLEELVPLPAARVAPARPLVWAAAVLTAPRPKKADYLPATLRSVEAAGFPRPLIFAEPESPIPSCRRADTTQHARQLGPYQNSLVAMTSLRLAMGTRDWDALLLCEDDILIEPGTRGYLDRALWPQAPESIGIVSIYLPAKFAAGPAGWEIFTGRTLYGAQALVLHRQFVEDYIWDAEFHRAHRTHKTLPGKKPRINAEPYADMELTRFCRERQRPAWIVRGQGGGSLVEHVGDVSALFPFGTDSEGRHAVPLNLVKGCC